MLAALRNQFGGHAVKKHDGRRRDTVAGDTLVILGGAGDSRTESRSPALYNLHVDGLSPGGNRGGCGRRKAMTDDDYREFAKGGVTEFSRQPIDETAWRTFAQSLFFVNLSIEDEGGLASLSGRGSTSSSTSAASRATVSTIWPCRQRHSSRPSSSWRGSALRRASGRRRPEPPAAVATPFARLIVEKPFGTRPRDGRAGYQRRHFATVFDERQIYRIDHYLGKETVQNLLVFRFANGIFEPVWNNRFVDHVQITGAETVGVEGRGGYFEQAGACATWCRTTCSRS